MKIPGFSALIVDDEADAQRMIALLLEEMFPRLEVLAIAGSVAEASREVTRCQPDIVFLDIQLPDGSGFDLLKRFPSFPAEVIFVTAYDSYGIQAVRASACDYILKPVSKTDFREAVNKALGRAERKQHEAAQLSAHHTATEVKKVGIPNLTGYRFVDANSIVRCEADGHYTSIYFTDGTRAYVSRILSHYEQELGRFGFFRIHHKHLVNLNFITAYSKGKGGGYVTMTDGTELEVATRKKSELLKTLYQGEY